MLLVYEVCTKRSIISMTALALVLKTVYGYLHVRIPYSTNTIMPTTVAKSVPSPFAQFMKDNASYFSVLKAGDLVQGTILEKSAHRVLLDLGKFGTGAIYRGELQHAKSLLKGLGIGDETSAKVVDIDNRDGYVELSLAQAGKQKAWSDATEILEKGDPVVVKMLTANKGGLTTEVAGLPAFLPISQLSNDHYPKLTEGDDVKARVTSALESLVGVELSVKVIEVNPRTGKLVVSERDAIEVSAKEFVKNYAVGQEIEGIVSGVADFGVFVRFTDNPSVEGLVHVSEVDWLTIENPKEIVKIDDVVRAKILDIKDGKISLSLKALKADPWQNAEGLYTEGATVRGTVYAFTPFGAIVNLDRGLQGIVHVTTFGSVEAMKQALPAKSSHEFMIDSMRLSERRITLSVVKT